MRKLLYWTIAGAAFAGLAPVAMPQGKVESAPTPLKASGSWTIEYAPASCIVTRKYGTGANEIQMSFVMLPRSKNAQLVFFDSDAKGPGPARVNFGTATFTTQPTGATFKKEFASGRIPDTNRRLFYARLNEEELANLTAAQVISIDAGKTLRLDVAPGKPQRAFEALKPCFDDLLAAWKIDPALLASVVTPVAAHNPADWMRNDDYPGEALRKGMSGTTTFRVTVDAAGKVSDCGILSSSGHALLDETTCALLRKRAKFHPALDAAGKPVPDLYIGRFQWIT